jgi:hypothetical protein
MLGKLTLGILAVGALTAAPVMASNGAHPHGSATTGCSVTATGTAPSALDIQAGGLAAGNLYSIWLTQADGMQAGATVSSDSTGSVDFSGFTAYQSGTYSVSVTKFHSNGVVATCSGTV